MAQDKFKVENGIEITDSVSVAGFTLVPVGTIGLWMTSSVPSGWLECSGGTFSSTTYPALAAVLGNTYGTSSGTTYYLPDFRGRVAIGTGTGAGLTARTLSQWGGSESISVTDGIISHTHTMSHDHNLNAHTHSHSGHSWSAHGTAHTHPTGSHTHGLSGNGGTHQHSMWFANTGAPGTTQPRNNSTGPATTVHSDTQGAHSHTLPAPGIDYFSGVDTSGDVNTSSGMASSVTSTDPNSGSTPTLSGTTPTISVMQESFVVKYIIKAF